MKRKSLEETNPLNGISVRVTPEGLREEGTFINDRLKYGSKILPNGKIYRGEYNKNGHIVEGTCQTNGQYLAGSWENGDLKDGVRYEADGTTFLLQEGEFNETSIRSGINLEKNRLLWGEYDGEKLVEGVFVDKKSVEIGSFNDGKLDKGTTVNRKDPSNIETGTYDSNFSLIEGVSVKNEHALIGKFDKNYLIKGTNVEKDGSVAIGKFKDGQLEEGTCVSEKDIEHGEFDEQGNLIQGSQLIGNTHFIGKFDNNKLRSGVYLYPEEEHLEVGDFDENEDLVKGTQIQSGVIHVGTFKDGNLEKGEMLMDGSYAQGLFSGSGCSTRLYGKGVLVSEDTVFRGNFEASKLISGVAVTDDEVHILKGDDKYIIKLQTPTVVAERWRDDTLMYKSSI